MSGLLRSVHPKFPNDQIKTLIQSFLEVALRSKTFSVICFALKRGEDREVYGHCVAFIKQRFLYDIAQDSLRIMLIAIFLSALTGRGIKSTHAKHAQPAEPYSKRCAPVLKRSILRYTRDITAKRVNEWRVPSPRFNAYATQLRRNVAAVARHWRHRVRFNRPGS